MNTEPNRNCFSAHRALVERAGVLSRRLSSDAVDESDLLRLGATCVDLAAQQALGAGSDRDAIRSWLQCERGERQIRSATFRALHNRRIPVEEYDLTFALARQATEARRDEVARLRRQLKLLAII
jgi:hypothetical protein